MKDIASGLWILERRRPVPDPCAGVLSINADGCGNLTAVVTGGGPGPFTFAWTGPGGFTSSAPSIAPLVSGVYNVTRQDCRDSVSIEFTPPQPLHFCACIDNAAKFPRTLTLSGFSGGSGAYTYSINGGMDTLVTLPQTVITVSAIVPVGDLIIITVKDANCAGATPVIKQLYCPADSFDFNNALEFDGVNDHIQTTALVGTPIPSQGTIVAWFKNGETPDFGGQIHGEDSGNAGGSRGMLWCGDPSLQMYLLLNVGQVQARIGSTTITRPIKPPYLDPNFRGGWIFAALTWVRSGGTYTFKLYVGDDVTGDWLAPATGTDNTYVAANFAAFNWGARDRWPAQQSTFPFYGFMDDLRYFDRALEECELECLFNDGAGNNMLDLDTNLRVYYKLDETGGNTANNAGTGGGALNGLMRGWSGLDGAGDTNWRTKNASQEAWRPHAAGASGVDYPALSFLGSEETVDLRYYLNNGDSFSFFTEIELHHPAPPATPLPRALFGVFRPTNSQMHGQTISALENCANPIHPWDCGIFDARVDETTGVLTVQIANLNDALHTSVSAALPNWQNRKIGLGFVVDAAAKNLKVFYNDGTGGASTTLINATYDDVNPDIHGNVWHIAGGFGGALLFGTPCPFVTDFPGGNCGANGLKSQALNLYDLHIYDTAFVEADFHNWFNEALGTTLVSPFNIRNERSLLLSPIQRRYRTLQKPLDYTALIDTGPLATDGLLYASVNSFFNLVQTGPNPNRCFAPGDWTQTFINPTVPGWPGHREIPTGTAWIID